MQPHQRRKAMAHNRGRTRPERILASALWRRGIRFYTGEGFASCTGSKLAGKPDLVLPRKRVVIFVDGCFWHGCQECRKHDGLHRQSWIDKIAGNVERDRRVTTELQRQGWTVLRIPEHDLNTKARLSHTVDELATKIHGAPLGREVKKFITDGRRTSYSPFTAVSLFSGAGLSDLGYGMAGFKFLVQVEADAKRSAVGAANFPDSTWLTRDVIGSVDDVAETYESKTSRRLDLLIATPPCQGMSSSNPSRGKRRSRKAQELEAKNRLMLELIPIANRLKPRVIVAENVRPVLTLEVEYAGKTGTVVEHLRNRLPDYEVFTEVVNVADYGIPQVRKRALIIAVHRRETWLDYAPSTRRPLPSATHAEIPTNGFLPWVTVRQWMELSEYGELDARSKDTARGKHWLHFVPSYEADRYLQISDIPPHSGQSAFENDQCPTCGLQEVELNLIRCPSCNAIMRNRPYVVRDGETALIKGFHSSYRRMRPDRPAYTITTNSSHIGSDFKIHPWENRVLSILECADLQTVPRFYNWSLARENRTYYLIRNLIGEAFPTYFTYLHGKFLSELLSETPNRSNSPERAETASRMGTNREANVTIAAREMVGA